MTERYADLYESLTKEALSFAERLFTELEIPLTDAEDVAAESALAVILANRRGDFKSAGNAAPPKDIPHVRRVRARAGLRRRFTPPYEAYHRELEAAKRRIRGCPGSSSTTTTGTCTTP